MKNFFFIFIIFLPACSANINKNNFDKNLDFPKTLNFDEFKLRLDQYSNQNSYPKIND